MNWRFVDTAYEHIIRNLHNLIEVLCLLTKLNKITVDLLNVTTFQNDVRYYEYRIAI